MFAIGAGEIGRALHHDHIHLYPNGYQQVLTVLLNAAHNMLSLHRKYIAIESA
jgi:hypothetical protein